MTAYVAGQESVLPLRVVPQPTPDVCAGGDCVLAGLTGLEVPEVYQRIRDGKVQTFDFLRERGGFNLRLVRPRSRAPARRDRCGP